MLAEKLMAADAENIVAAVVTAARNGDMTTAKIILDRLVPVRRAVPFDLPKIESEADVIPEAHAQVRGHTVAKEGKQIRLRRGWSR